MSFGEQLTHLAQANYLFAAGLKDSRMATLPAPEGKEAIVNSVRFIPRRMEDSSGAKSCF
jgi:hypothetical protein